MMRLKNFRGNEDLLQAFAETCKREGIDESETIREFMAQKVIKSTDYFCLIDTKEPEMFRYVFKCRKCGKVGSGLVQAETQNQIGRLALKCSNCKDTQNVFIPYDQKVHEEYENRPRVKDRYIRTNLGIMKESETNTKDFQKRNDEAIRERFELVRIDQRLQAELRERERNNDKILIGGK